ncbi:hypothetical protein [Hyphobacterium sp.]|uniref:hypothetical protein n=1 Tax=Hyphobacterium sp. TaxID=2004662 RepID=UPI003BAB31C2
MSTNQYARYVGHTLQSESLKLDLADCEAAITHLDSEIEKLPDVPVQYRHPGLTARMSGMRNKFVEARNELKTERDLLIDAIRLAEEAEAAAAKTSSKSTSS